MPELVVYGRRKLVVYGAKGGVGTSTVVALMACGLARSRTVNVTGPGARDVADILGSQDGITFDPDALADVELVDNGTTPAPDGLVVAENSYLSLRRLITGPITDAAPTHLVVVVDSARPLTLDDAAAVSGIPVTSVVRCIETARATDAGLLATSRLSRREMAKLVALFDQLAVAVG